MNADSQAVTPPNPTARIAHPLHTVAVLAVLALLFLCRLLFGPALGAAPETLSHVSFYVRTIAGEWLLLAVVLLGMWRARSPLAAVLGPRWRSLKAVATDLGIGVALMLVGDFFVNIVAAHTGAAQADRVAAALLPIGPLELSLWMVLSVTAGICEEAVYRGYLQRQLGALTGSAVAGIALSAALFGLGHAYLGVGRAITLAFSGALFGVVAQWRRSVRPGMIAHALTDAIAPLLLRLFHG